MAAGAQRPGERRILFAADAGRSHVKPLFAIAAELAARGDRDQWFACGEEYRAEVEAVDEASPPRLVPLGPARPEQDPANWSDAEMDRVTTSSPLRNLAAITDLCLDFEQRRRQYLRMLEIVDTVRPTLAVVDLFSSWAIDALTMRRIPYVALCPQLVSSVYFDRLPRSYPTPLSGLRREMSPPQRLHNVAFRMGRRLVGFRPGSLRENLAFYRSRVAEGQSNPESKLSQYADEAIAVFSCSVFGLEYPFPRVPANLRMIGTMLGPRRKSATPYGALADWLDLHESVVYISFGSVMRPTAAQAEAIVRAAERLAPVHQLLWQLPKTQQGLLPPILPDNLRVESEIASQLDVLAHQHVQVFFNHGAAGCVHEGLYFGKPQLVLPFWMNDVDNAARIRDSGAGLALNRRQSADGWLIADRLRLLLSEPAFRAHAVDWRDRLRAAGGSGAAADSIVAALDRIERNPA